MPSRKPEAWAKWRSLLSAHRSSGQSIAGFCRGRGLPVSQFFAWRKRLDQTAAGPFVEVELVDPAPSLPPSPAIEVLLSGGHRLSVAAGFDPRHLRAVVAALQSRA